MHHRNGKKTLLDIIVNGFRAMLRPDGRLAVHHIDTPNETVESQWYVDPLTNKVWVPAKSVFRTIIKECTESGKFSPPRTKQLHESRR